MATHLIDRRSAFLSGVALALTAGLRQARADAPRRGGTLTAQTYSDLRFLNPALRASFAISVFTSKMIEPLVDLAADGSPAPKLATGWQAAPDGKTITFALRTGVPWHDGKPFTAADVQYCAMELWKKHQNYGTTLHKALVAVDTPDDHTAVFRYDKPMPLALLLRMSAEFCSVVPRHVFEGTDVLKNPANTAPIGTGPFKFAAYQPGQHLILERNPAYWVPDQPYLDRLVIRVIGDPPAAAAALEAGDTQISLFSSLPRTDFVRLAKDARFRVSTAGSEANPVFNTLGFNCRRKELADARVRRALAQAIDLDFYIKNFLMGYGKRAHGPIPAASPFYQADAALDLAYDPKRAEAVLDDAGYRRGSDGTRFTLRLLPNSSEEIRRFGTFVQQSLQKVGVKVRIETLDAPGFSARVNRDHDFDLAADTATLRLDPAVGTTQWYGSGIPAGTPWSNQWGWQSEALDRAVDQALVEADPAARQALYATFARIARTELPVWMAVEQLFITAVSARVRNDNNMPRWTGSSWADLWLAD